MLCSAQAENADDYVFLDSINKHKSDGTHTQSDFTDRFREKIGQDIDGSLIKLISKDPRVNSIIFYHFDAVPQQFVELVLANWLEDDTQWEIQGSVYNSPAGPFWHWLSLNFGQKESKQIASSFPLQFVMENKGVRREMAEIIREGYSEHDLRNEQRLERRRKAWNEIINILEVALPRLLQENQELRVMAAKELQQLPTNNFTKKQPDQNGKERSVSDLKNDETKEHAHWLWYLLLGMATVIVAVIYLRIRISSSR